MVAMMISDDWLLKCFEEGSGLSKRTMRIVARELEIDEHSARRILPEELVGVADDAEVGGPFDNFRIEYIPGLGKRGRAELLTWLTFHNLTPCWRRPTAEERQGSMIARREQKEREKKLRDQQDPKAKYHEFIVSVRFNKKCCRRVALRDARDIIHGLHYTTVIDDGDPETMRVVSIKAAK